MAGDRRRPRRRLLRVGLAGLGTMGQNHLRLIRGRADVELTAVSDVAQETLERIAAQTNARGFADPLEMIEATDLDALIVATPTTTHAAIALRAIERGVPVLVEKPLADTVGACLRILDAARQAGVPVQAGHVERFNPAVIELGRLLASGWLSAVYSIASRRAGPFPPRIRDVGVTIDLATHDVDILSWIAGERPTRVYAETAKRLHTHHEDLLFGLLHFPSGTTGFVDVNWLTPSKRRDLLVVGGEGSFELDYLTQRLTFTRQPDVTQPTLIGGYAPTFAAEVREVVVPRGEPLAAQLESFVAVARGEIAPIVNAEDALWAVATANALLESAAEVRPIDLHDISAASGVSAKHHAHG